MTSTKNARSCPRQLSSVCPRPGVEDLWSMVTVFILNIFDVFQLLSISFVVVLVSFDSIKSSVFAVSTNV